MYVAEVNSLQSACACFYCTVSINFRGMCLYVQGKESLFCVRTKLGAAPTVLCMLADTDVHAETLLKLATCELVCYLDYLCVCRDYMK